MEPNILLNLRKFLSPEIVYGAGAIELAGCHALNFGATKALVVTDPGVQKAGWAARVESSLKQSGIPYVVFNGVRPNPKDFEVMEGAAVYKDEGCDLIVAVGGGSPMDCAKGIGVVAGNPAPITAFEGVDEIPHPGPPLIFIPTTAGTSADVSQFAIITDSDRKLKMAVISKMVIPDIALVDPTTTRTMSPELTAATGMDALCHAVEAFVSTASSPLTDMAAFSAVRLIMENLPRAYRSPQNMDYRDKVMMASLMAGLAFSNASLGLVHAMAHSLGGAFDLAHGECNAMLLEKVVLYNFEAAAEKYAQLGGAMGIDLTRIPESRRASALAERIAQLRSEMGINLCLSAMGVSFAAITTLSQNASKDPCLATNPRGARPEDIERLFTQIYAGQPPGRHELSDL